MENENFKEREILKERIREFREMARCLLEDHADEIPVNIIHGEPNRYKIRANWFQNVFTCLEEICEVLSVDKGIEMEIANFMRDISAGRNKQRQDYFKMDTKQKEKFLSDRKGEIILTTKEEICKSNEILKKVIAYLDEQLTKL